MAVSFLNREVSDLCLGKPALRPIIPATATLAEAIAVLKRTGETHVSVWMVLEEDDYSVECHCIGKVSMVDVICYLCKQESLIDSSKVLEIPVLKILAKGDSIVKHLEPDSRFVTFFFIT